MALACQGFGEDINDLDQYRDTRKSDNLAVIGFSNKLTFVLLFVHDKHNLLQFVWHLYYKHVVVLIVLSETKF